MSLILWTIRLFAFVCLALSASAQSLCAAAPPCYEGPKHQGHTLRHWFLEYGGSRSSELTETVETVLSDCEANERHFILACKRLLSDSDAFVRYGVVKYLAREKGPPSLLVPDLRYLVFHDPDGRVRRAAVGLLADAAEGNRPVLRDLERVAKTDKDAEVRSMAVYSFRALDAAAPLAPATVVSCLSDPAPSVRSQAAYLYFSRGLIQSHAKELTRMISKEQDADVLLSVGYAAEAAPGAFMKLCARELAAKDRPPGRRPASRSLSASSSRPRG
jgi:hypothetical protein